MLEYDDFKTYLKHDGVNASLLKDLRKSPLNAFGFESENDTDAMKFGRMYHAFLLEPENFTKFYLPYDVAKRPEQDKTMASNKNKAWKYELQASGLELINGEQIEVLEAMRNALRKYAAPAMNLLASSYREASCYTDLQLAGGKTIHVKGRFDCINVERGAIMDLKTTVDATPDGFSKEAGNLAYHVQAAFYLRLAEHVFKKPFKFFVLAQEKKAPFNVLLREVSNSMREKGDFEIDKLLEAAHYIRESGDVQSYNVFTNDDFGIVPLDIPDYHVMKHDFNFKNKKTA